MKRYIVHYSYGGVAVNPTRLVFSDAEGFNLWLKSQAAFTEMFPGTNITFTVTTEDADGQS